MYSPARTLRSQRQKYGGGHQRPEAGAGRGRRPMRDCLPPAPCQQADGHLVPCRHISLEVVASRQVGVQYGRGHTGGARLGLCRARRLDLDADAAFRPISAVAPLTSTAGATSWRMRSRLDLCHRRWLRPCEHDIGQRSQQRLGWCSHAVGVAVARARLESVARER